MRIVHEVYTPMNPSGGINGPNASVFATEAHPADHPDLPAGMFGSEEVIEIEGDSKYLVELLEGWLKCLRSAQAEFIRRKAVSSEQHNQEEKA